MAQNQKSPASVEPGSNGIPSGDINEAFEARRTALQARYDEAYAPVVEKWEQFKSVMAQANELQSKADALKAEANVLHSTVLAPFSAIAESAKAELDAFNRATKYVPAALTVLRLKTLTGQVDEKIITRSINEYLESYLPMRADGSGKHVKATTKAMDDIHSNVNRAIELVQTFTK